MVSSKLLDLGGHLWDDLTDGRFAFQMNKKKNIKAKKEGKRKKKKKKEKGFQKTSILNLLAPPTSSGPGLVNTSCL